MPQFSHYQDPVAFLLAIPSSPAQKQGCRAKGFHLLAQIIFEVEQGKAQRLNARHLPAGIRTHPPGLRQG